MLSQLESRTAVELKRLCFNTGISSSGLKNDIIQALTEEFQKQSVFQRIPNNKKNFNILSIDMGIKNFSYARLELDKTLPFNKPPYIKEWAKLDVNEWADVSNDATYEPKKYADLSYRVVDELIFDKEQDVPDAILIERQRIRSAGGKNVLEWVYRVNMFESMLHALVHARKINDPRAKDTVVVPTSPQRMGLFWTPRVTETYQKKNSKKLRIKLMEHWLKTYSAGSHRGPFVLPTSISIINDPLHKRSASKWIFETVMRNSKFYNPDANPHGIKGDDLADSLLHGLSFYEWEKNRMLLNQEFKESPDRLIKVSDKIFEQHMDRLEVLNLEHYEDMEKNKEDNSKPLEPVQKPEKRLLKETK